MRVRSERGYTHTNSNKSLGGYTIIELMIASMVFSVILLGASASLIQIGRMYYKGVITSRTQGVTRTLTDEISRGVQFSDQTVSQAGPEEKGTGDKISVSAVCIGTTRYTYAINVEVSDSASTYTNNNHRAPHALWKDEVTDAGDCNPGKSLPDLTSNSLGGGTEMLESSMRLKAFDVCSGSGGDTLCAINIGVVYGDDDVLNFSNESTKTDPKSCQAIVTGAQWCAISQLSTQVFKRIRENT